VKDGTKPPCERRLTPQQERFHAEWKGQRCIVESVDDVIALVKSVPMSMNALKEKFCGEGKGL